MAELKLEWVESGVTKSYKVELSIIRIGRDPARCDLVLSHPTVSGLHVVIYFDPQKQSFWIRNMRESNPPIVDGQRLVQGEMKLQKNSAIALGQQLLRVTEIQILEIQRNPPILQENSQPAYGLQCPNLKCARISPYEKITLVCPWCGTSLAGAVSSIL